ncbi:MAG TPA: PAS domain S-box protein [Bryobacteraceae bacterium]|jgi:PAS domain S-box-containing protein|nr:PAS domain S-box protein [Bryobacteraceae bacterium]
MREETQTNHRRVVLGSLSFLLVAVALFVCSVLLDAKTNRLSSVLVLFILLSIIAAATFRLVYCRIAVRRRIAADANAYSRERELTSIFEHALDGIVILDDASVCIDANPAACRLLNVVGAELMGRSFGDFHADRKEFAHHWKSFLSAGYQRGETRLLSRDRQSVFVEYTATANYVPGRHVLILCDNTRQKRAETSFQNIEKLFRQMADHIQEVFWLMDAQSKKLIYVNRAFETVTGRLRSSIEDDLLSYQEIVHADDRIAVISKLADSVTSGEFNEEFRVTRTDGSIRWIWSRAFPVRDPSQPSGWIIGTALDVTSRKQAEIDISRHLAAAEAARSEAEALRRATLALTQNLAMDSILDTLLACLADVVPYTSACVLFAETDSQLLVAREAPRRSPRGAFTVLNPTEYPLLNKVLMERKSVLVADTREDSCWQKCKIFSDACSWMGIPLVASDRILGILSIGASAPHTFTPEHFRMAKSLAIPAAVGIQNARIHELAAIYASELEVQLRTLNQTRRALEQSRSSATPQA